MKKLLYLVCLLFFSCENQSKETYTTQKDLISEVQGDYLLDSTRFNQLLGIEVTPENTTGKLKIDNDSLFLDFTYSNIKSEMNAQLIIEKDSITVSREGITEAFLVKRRKRVYYVSLDRKAYIPFKKIDKINKRAK